MGDVPFSRRCDDVFLILVLSTHFHFVFMSDIIVAINMFVLSLLMVAYEEIHRTYYYKIRQNEEALTRLVISVNWCENRTKIRNMTK